MSQYEVFDGAYPFNMFKGYVSVPFDEDKEREARTALGLALREYGPKVVVQFSINIH